MDKSNPEFTQTPRRALISSIISLLLILICFVFNIYTDLFGAFSFTLKIISAIALIGGLYSLYLGVKSHKYLAIVLSIIVVFLTLVGLASRTTKIF
jgi:hypothetical protein